jgi:predicted nicotinamide N-methyase
MEAGKESLNTNETTSRIEVAPIDWAKRETWPKQKKFDILLGSDIVYHKDIVPILADTVDGLLTSNGQFLHVASDQRDALPEFKDAMEAKGFTCEVHIVPDVYKRNPLVGQSAELFDLHFNEMEDTYCMYTFTRTDSFSNVP